MKKLKGLLFWVMTLITMSLYSSEVRADESELMVGDYTRNELNIYISETCENYAICPELIVALIETESIWDPDARNGACLGLMQINPKWQKERMEELGVTNLYNPKENILLGIDYINYLHERCENTEYDDISYVLMAYNMGEYKAKQKYDRGEISNYAYTILERSAELEREHEAEDIDIPTFIEFLDERITYANQTTAIMRDSISLRKGEITYELERKN